MISFRFGMTFLGIAALAATAAVVHQVHAADIEGIMKIVAAIKANKPADAKAAAKAYADDAVKNKVGIDDLMEGFGKKALVADGIQKKLVDFSKAVGPADFANKAYEDFGNKIVAVGMVCEATSAPQGGKITGTPKEWTAFSKDLAEQGAKFQDTFKAKKGTDAVAASKAIEASCFKCHQKFNP